mmetsp:Transcript_22067/g.45934  ORF Transcript_22067/g.45934 Transcript_22067/m.45934 type:complete len:215 (-) Transcript_22067:53-697(-)
MVEVIGLMQAPDHTKGGAPAGCGEGACVADRDNFELGRTAGRLRQHGLLSIRAHGLVCVQVILQHRLGALHERRHYARAGCTFLRRRLLDDLGELVGRDEEVHRSWAAGPQVLHALEKEVLRLVRAHASHLARRIHRGRLYRQAEAGHHGDQRRASDLHLADDAPAVIGVLHRQKLEPMRHHQLVQHFEAAAGVPERLQRVLLLDAGGRRGHGF